MKGTFVAAVATLWATSTVAQELLPCGDAQYNPSQYVCYDGDFLCPILNGAALLRCGDSCYSDQLYTCNDGRLEQLIKTTRQITVEAINPAAPIHQMKFEACDRGFFLGPDGPCTYCPDDVPEGDCPPGDKTVFFPGSSMSVEAPGGQLYYIEPDGTLGFTDASNNSNEAPPGSVFGVTAYENGAFTYGGAGWVACPREGSNPPEWKIFAQLPGTVFAGSCISFDAAVRVEESNEKGAYYYI